MPEETGPHYGGKQKEPEFMIGGKRELVEELDQQVDEPMVRNDHQACFTRPPDDPWMHRTIGMRCKTCMWFVEKRPAKIGRCRRHAPTMNGYPAVFTTDWCGDHKLDETKL